MFCHQLQRTWSMGQPPACLIRGIICYFYNTSCENNIFSDMSLVIFLLHNLQEVVKFAKCCFDSVSPVDVHCHSCVHTHPRTSQRPLFCHQLSTPCVTCMFSYWLCDLSHVTSWHHNSQGVFQVFQVLFCLAFCHQLICKFLHVFTPWNSQKAPCFGISWVFAVWLVCFVISCRERDQLINIQLTSSEGSYVIYDITCLLSPPVVRMIVS